MNGDMTTMPIVADAAAGDVHSTPASAVRSFVDTLLSLLSLLSKSKGGNAALAGRVMRIVVTGGPCGGKTVSLKNIRQAVEAATPYKVFCVPEAATLFSKGHVKLNTNITAEALQNQLALLRAQRVLEDEFLRLAANCGQPAIVIADRGLPDGGAYMADEAWAQMLASEGYAHDALRDDRYDAVIHLRTSAIGAQAFYRLDDTRYEQLAEAVRLDGHTQRMYQEHPCVHVVESTERFDDKMKAVVRVVLQLIGHNDTHEGAHQDATGADAAMATRCAAHFERQRRVVADHAAGGGLTHTAASLTAPSVGVAVLLVAVAWFLWLRLTRA